MSVNYTNTFTYQLFIKTAEEFQSLDIQELYSKLSKKDMSRIPVEIWNNLSLKQVYESSVTYLSYFPMASLLFLLQKYQHINEQKIIEKKLNDKSILIESEIPKTKIEKAIMLLNDRMNVRRKSAYIQDITLTDDNQSITEETITLDKCCKYFSVTEKKHLQHLNKETNEIEKLPLYQIMLNSSIFTKRDDFINFIKICRVGEPAAQLPKKLISYSELLAETNILNKNVAQFIKYAPHYRLVNSVRFDLDEVRDIAFEQQIKSLKKHHANISTLKDLKRIPKVFAYYFVYKKYSREEFDTIIKNGEIKLFNNEQHLLDFDSFSDFCRKHEIDF